MTQSPLKSGEFCWNELMTTDVAKAKTFYKTLLGWEYEEHAIQDGSYFCIKGLKNSGGGMMQLPEHLKAQVPSHWMTYISVEDLEQYLQKAIDLGATVKMPITAAGDFGRFAIILDPTGAYVALWQSKNACSS